MTNPVENLWQKNLEGLEGFGEFIRNQRKFASLSQRQLARLAELSDTYMSQLERGLHEPSIRVVRALANALNIDPHELIKRAAGIEDTDERPLTEEAITRDPRFTDAQKQALLQVVDSYLR